MFRAERSASHRGAPGGHYHVQDDARQWWRKPAAVALAVLMMTAIIALVPVVAKVASGQEVQPFTPAFHTDDNGAIAIFGNANETCPPGTIAPGTTPPHGSTARLCDAVQQTDFVNTPGAGSDTNNENNSWHMVDVNVDPDGSQNYNSSSATVSLPAGSSVLFAGLFWEGRMFPYAGPSPAVQNLPCAPAPAPPAQPSLTCTSGVNGVAPFDAMKLRGPTGDYTTIHADSFATADAGDANSTPAGHGTGYGAYADVTGMVQSLGEGTWTGANVASATGSDMFAGWSLVIAYRNPADPLRDLTVFQGFALVTNSDTVQIPISGFLAPLTGPVDAEIGVVAGEGDMSITGDSMKVNSTYLTDAANPQSDFFNSQDSVDGVICGAASAPSPCSSVRNPDYSNMLGWDLKQVASPNAIANGATSAQLALSTSGDTYYPDAVTTQLDEYAPQFAPPTKAVEDLQGNNPAKIGDTLRYTLTFTNIGLDAAKNVVLRDPIPTNTTYVPESIHIVAGANPGAKTDTANDDQAEFDGGASPQVVARLGTGANASSGGTLEAASPPGQAVNPNSSTSVSFDVTVNPPAAGTTVTNQGFLDYTAATLNKSFTYDTNVVDTPVGGGADLSITKSASSTTAAPGGNLVYTLLAQNHGPMAAADATVSDTLPSGTTFVSATATGGSCTEPAPPATATLTCSLGDMASGATQTITLTVKLDLNFAGDSVSNTGTITSGTYDPNPLNNTSNVVVPVAAEADMSITKTANPASPGTVHAGDEITYTLVATNNGPSYAQNVTVSDAVPLGTTLVSFTPTAPTCSELATTLACHLGTMTPGDGDARTISVVVRVDPSAAPGTLTNSAVVASTTPDPDRDNNNASATTDVGASADVAISKRADPGTFVPGEAARYTLTADNAGPSDAQDVTVTDDLPAGLTYVNASPSQGSPCTNVSGKVTCALGTLPAGAGATVTINVTVDALTAGTVTNTATVDSTTFDPDHSNNSDTIHTPVQPLADVAIEKDGNPNPVAAGNTLSYTLSVVNHGPSDAHDVKVSDPLPDEVIYRSLTSTAGTTCTEASGIVSCDLGTLAVNGTATIVIVTMAHPGAVLNSFTNTADVSSTTHDPDGSNNSASFHSNLFISADMAITKVGSPKPVVAGNQLTYTLEATNNGPSLARNVTVSDPLPARTTFASVTTSAGTCSESSGTVSCSVGNVRVGAEHKVTIVITVTVGAGAPLLSQIRNTATVGSTTPDPAPSNNTAEDDTDVATEADLVLTKTATPATVDAGHEVTYTIEARNDGPSDAEAAGVTDLLPSDVTFVSATPSSGTCAHAVATVLCELGTLPAGATATITIVARVKPSTPEKTSISNTAEVLSLTHDPNLLNNFASARVTVDTSADVAIAKSATPTSFVPGRPARYTLTATNLGPSDAQAVTVTDSLPPELTYVAALPSTGTCTETGGTVSCDLGTLPAGAEATVTIDVTVHASTTGTVTNTGHVHSNTTDPVPGNNTATIHTPVAPSADVAIVKTGAPNPVTAGNTLTYTLEVVNLGPSDAQDVIVSDPLPPEVTYISSSATAGTCTEASNTVTCDLGTLALGGTDTIHIVATAEPGTPPKSFENTAHVSSTTHDPHLHNNSSSFTSNLSTSADVALTKVGSPKPVTAGDNLTYTLEATNHGPSVASSVTVSDPLPAGTTFVSATTSAGTCSESAGTLSCSMGDLTVGETGTIVVTVTVGASVPAGPLTNTATASSPTPDPITPNTATDETDVITEADLVLTKTATPGTVFAGNQVTYTLTAHNAGPSDAQDAEVTDELPSGVTFVSAAPASAGCAAVGQQVTCGLGTLAAGTTAAPVTIVASVQASTPPGTLINTGTVSSVTPDPDLTNNSSSAGTMVAGSADVAITKVPSPNTFSAGQAASYTLTATNNGPSYAQAVTVTDALPGGLTFSSAVPSQGIPCTQAAGTVTCHLGPLPAGAKATVIINVTVGPSTSEAVTNTATVASTTPDPDVSNNTDTVVTPVSPLPPVVSADMAITKIGAPNPVFNGNALTYTLSVVNNGPFSAQAVTVSDPLPAEFAFGSVSTTIGTCTQSSGTVTCDLGTMAASAKATVTIVGTAHPGTPAVSFTNTATVSSTTPDPDPTNNSASFTSDFFGADVAITKVGSPKPVTAGHNLTYTLKVSNGGPDAATDVTAADPLPAGTSLVSATTSAGTCSNSSGTVSCSLGDLAVGDTVTIVIVVTVDASVTAKELTNTATASSPTPDPGTSNNTATDTTEVVANADLAVTKTASPATVHAGENVTYTVKATNGGPSEARSVVVSDVLPASLTFVTAVPATANCTVAGVQHRSVTCQLGNLAAGTTSTISIVARVDPSTRRGTITNNAVVSSQTPDPNPDNNHDSATTNVDTSADLAITKSASPSPLLAGRPATYTLLVVNAGPSDAESVVVTDTLPGSVTFVGATPTHGGPCTTVAATVTCDLGTVRAGAGAKAYIHVTVKASTTASVTNEAKVTSPTPDPDLTNNSSAVTTPVDPDANLAIVKTASPEPVTAGDKVTYTLAVSNAGPADARAVTVTDHLPAGTTIVSVTPRAGTCANAGPTVTCSLGTVPALKSVTIEVVLQTSPSLVVGTLANTATVSSATHDPDLANNSSTATSKVTHSADVAIAKSFDTNPTVAGLNQRFVIQVTNKGPSDASDVVVSDPLPPVVALVAAKPTQGSCTGTARVTCSLGTVPAGEVVTIELDVRLDAAVAPGSNFSNTATVTSTTADPNLANNTATAADPVATLADISLTKTGPANFTAGANGNYTFRIASAAHRWRTALSPSPTTFRQG